MRSSLCFLPRVLPYLRPYWFLLAVAVILTLVSVVAGLAQPWPLAFLVDSALGDKAAPRIVRDLVGTSASAKIAFAVAAGLAIALLTSGVTVVGNYVETRLEQRMILDFRSDLFEHVQKLSLAFHDNQRKGMLMFALNYQAAAVGEITVTMLPLAQAALTVVGMFLVTLRLDPVLAMLSMTVVPFIYCSTRFYGERIEPRLRRVRDLEATSLSIVHEAMSMLRVIVAFGRERYEHERFRAQGSEAIDARIGVTLRQTLFSLGVSLITAAGTALVIGFGAHLVLRRRLTVGELLIVLSYIAAVYKPLEEISGTMAGLQEQLISLEAAVKLMDREPEVNDPEDGVVLDRAVGHLVFQDVYFTYQGRVDTLKDISFEVEAGEVVGIVGPTGAGKSTLVSLIPRFMDPKQGRILLDGVDIRAIQLGPYRDQISIVLQEPLLFSGTIGDNIRYGRLDATTEDVVEAAKAANAHDFIDRLPHGYDTELGERGAQLSGGERQRIAIARAFLKDAPILILDEPTSAIDSKTEAVILEALGRLMVGRTTLMIAHRLSTLRNASKILVLNDGEIVQRGTHDELADREGLYREMYEAQAGQRAKAPVPAVSLAVPPQSPPARRVGPRRPRRGRSVISDLVALFGGHPGRPRP